LPFKCDLQRYITDICSPNGEDNYPRMKLSRFVIDLEEETAKHHCLSDLPCELPITSWDYTGKPYQHMYLSSAVGTNENGVNGPMQALTKVSLPSTDALGGATEVEWVPGDSKFAMEPFFVVGLYKLKSAGPHSLKAPGFGFNP
jgi:all-trans-8'-apo-beta-carotenal 15,15'-oxygenase